jgi:tetratricopeptide (TPR) repeat protein
MAKHDNAGARQALEQATAVDGSLLASQLMLGTLYERSEEWDAAIARYRLVIAKNPNQFGALNNLAYALAVRKKDPAAALPLAKRAYALSKARPSSPTRWPDVSPDGERPRLPLIWRRRNSCRPRGSALARRHHPRAEGP